MGIRIDAKTPAGFRINGKLAAGLRIGGNVVWTSAPPVVIPPGPLQPWVFATSFANALAIDVTIQATGDLYENSPAEGTLHRNHPAGMFTDNTIYWIERVRSQGSEFQLHRGGSTIQQRDFLPALGDEWTWYIIQLNAAGDAPAEPLNWKAFRANVGLQNVGGGFAEYDTNETDYVNIGGSTAAFNTFLGTLRGDRVAIILAPNAAYIPGTTMTAGRHTYSASNLVNRGTLSLPTTGTISGSTWFGGELAYIETSGEVYTVNPAIPTGAVLRGPTGLVDIDHQPGGMTVIGADLVAVAQDFDDSGWVAYRVPITNPAGRASLRTYQAGGDVLSAIAYDGKLYIFGNGNVDSVNIPFGTDAAVSQTVTFSTGAATHDGTQFVLVVNGILYTGTTVGAIISSAVSIGTINPRTIAWSGTELVMIARDRTIYTLAPD